MANPDFSRGDTIPAWANHAWNLGAKAVREMIAYLEGSKDYPELKDME